MIVLISVIYISNRAADWETMEAGFQAMSLPLVIVLIMAVLSNYINTFIVKQRAKEFASSLLLGMEKNKLARMFLCELCVIGAACYVMGVLLGAGVYSAYFHYLLRGDDSRPIIGMIKRSLIQTFGYFCVLEILSLFCIRQKIIKLQIVRLMRVKQRKQPPGAGGKAFWRGMSAVSFLLFLLLSGIAFLSDEVMAAAISIIAIPLVVCVFSFYKWLYASMACMRLSQTEALYQGNRLYWIAELTTGAKTNAQIHSIFQYAEQQWMGFLQIGICIIFLVIYFSSLSLMQMIDLKREKKYSVFILYGEKSIRI